MFTYNFNMYKNTLYTWTWHLRAHTFSVRFSAWSDTIHARRTPC